MRTSIIPVIHYHDDDLAMWNAEKAHETGCDGILLIDMAGDGRRLVPIAQQVKIERPDLLVGVNHLGLDPLQSLRTNMAAGLDMTWTDHQPTHTEAIDDDLAKRMARQIRGGSHLLFTGVAFKHQRPEPDPVGAALSACAHGFIPTTSGPATGVAADPRRIAALRAGIGDSAPLAIASGITPGNFAMFAPYLSHALVATGVSSSFHELDADLLEELVQQAF